MRTITRVALITLLAAGTLHAAVPATLAERVASVFPFQVGQQYEFKAGADFTTVEGDVLPAGTVATITVTDTVINDTTYLHIPYWASMGTGYYRLDEDSTIIWNRHPVTGEEAVFLYIGFTGVQGGVGLLPATEANDYVFLFGNTLHSPPALPDCPTEWPRLYWAYSGVYAPSKILVDDGTLGMGWVARCYMSETEWLTGLAYGFLYTPPSAEYIVHELHDTESAGAAYHFIDAYPKLCGLFRPVSADPWPAFVGSAQVQVGAEGRPPAELALTASPNPFNPTTALRYALPADGHVRMVVYSLTGQRVATLIDTDMPAGRHTIAWHGQDDAGRQVGSGPYLIRMTTASGSISKRVLLVR